MENFEVVSPTEFCTNFCFSTCCLCNVHHQYNELSNQQDGTTFSFMNHLNQLYMFRATDPPILRSNFDCVYSFWYNALVGSIFDAFYQKLYIQSKVFLSMGESVARNVLGWFERLINEKVVTSSWLLTSFFSQSRLLPAHKDSRWNVWIINPYSYFTDQLWNSL
jgi:hypothetical protein